MVSVEKALGIILNNIVELPDEQVPVVDAFGRSLFREITAREDIPPVDNSAMDGYAVLAADTSGASRDVPCLLEIIEEIRAGDTAMGVRTPAGKAVRIMTGAPIPEGADAVVKFEDTSEEKNRLEVFNEVGKGENIRRAGEDIACGSIVLPAGHRLGSADLGLLASLNFQEVRVYRRPRVAVISTGDEIAEVGGELPPGHIRNSNAYTLHGELLKYGAVPFYLGIARDNPAATADLIGKSLEYDACITTGGVSMGRYDFVKEAALTLGIEILFENINMKPGKPCVFGRKGSFLFFGLPGNPVSTMVSFIQFIRPALLRMAGVHRINKPLVKAVLDQEIRKKPDRVHFIRGFFTIQDGVFHVSTTGPQGSGILRSMTDANCLIIVPKEVDRLSPGRMVDVQLIFHEEI